MIKLTHKTKFVADKDCVKLQPYRHALWELFTELGISQDVLSLVDTRMYEGAYNFFIDGCYKNFYMQPILYALEIDVKSFCYYRALSENYKISAIREFRNEAACYLLDAKTAIETIMNFDFNIKHYEHYTEVLTFSLI